MFDVDSLSLCRFPQLLDFGAVVRRHPNLWPRIPKAFATIRLPLDNLKLKMRSSYVRLRLEKGFISHFLNGESVVFNNEIRHRSIISGK